LLCSLQEGLSAVLGDVRAQLALSLSALLPWLCVHFRGSPHSNLAAVCIAVTLLFLAKTLARIMSPQL
jgi:hypothetical protein